MEKRWKSIEDYRTNEPPAVDLESSPTTVYLNRKVKRRTKTDEGGNPVEYWSCEQLQLSREEYENLKLSESIFLSPKFQTLMDAVEQQNVTLAETQLNAEYTICLQELAME